MSVEPKTQRKLLSQSLKRHQLVLLHHKTAHQLYTKVTELSRKSWWRTKWPLPELNSWKFKGHCLGTTDWLLGTTIMIYAVCKSITYFPNADRDKLIKFSNTYKRVKRTQKRARSRAASLVPKWVEVVWLTYQDTFWMLYFGGLKGHHGRSRTSGRDYIYPIWPGKALGSSKGELENVAGEREVRNTLLSLLSVIWQRSWMDRHIFKMLTGGGLISSSNLKNE